MEIKQITDIITDQLRQWEVPSASVCLVQDETTLLSQGFGLRDGAREAADGDTLYQIASCSKAFTATAAAILATEGALDFDRPVAEYLPGFRLQDSYATEHLTVRDFLSHRSGLPRHELAWYGSGFSRAQLMANLKYLPLNAPIRYTFQYSNFNYLIVGCLIEAISGMSFEEFLEQKLFLPLGMERTLAFSSQMLQDPNHALPFDRLEPFTTTGIRSIPFYRSPAECPGTGDPTAAAGCVISCASDMEKWLRFNLSRGRTSQGQLVREDLMELLYTPHMDLGGGGAYAPQRSMASYGLGWFRYSYRGCRMLEHGGNINGFSSSVALLPDQNLGVFVSVNMNTSLLADAIVHHLVDEALGAGDGSWYQRLRQENQRLMDTTRQVYAAFGGTPVPGTKPSHPLTDYVGDYTAPGYRRFRIGLRDGKLTGDFNTFTVDLRHHHYDSFATEGVIGEIPPGLVLTFSADPKGQIHSLSVVLGTEKSLAPTVFVKEI